MEQLPKLGSYRILSIENKISFIFFIVITYRQGTDERAKRALDILQLIFRCCGSDGRLSYQNNVPLSCTMFYVGCLTRTMYFLDASMDSLAFVLLFFSLIKLFIILFFYSFLCLHRQKRMKSNGHLIDDSSIWRHSSSLDSSPMDSLPRKNFLLPLITNEETNDTEKRDYDLSSSPNISRKLSAISERTERNETDDSEIDLSSSRYYQPTHGGYITTIVPTKYPPVKSRRRIIRINNDDDDSGNCFFLFSAKEIFFILLRR
jgi:hypothetical protein